MRKFTSGYNLHDIHVRDSGGKIHRSLKKRSMDTLILLLYCEKKIAGLTQESGKEVLIQWNFI